MLDFTLIALFIPTFMVVSATPGMCMTLALVLGMRLGYRRTLPMMAGELVGVAAVAISAVLGVAAIMLAFPIGFMALKWIGGLYLIYLGVQSFRARGKMAMSMEAEETPIHPYALASQGFITAVANPKGWAFTVALLPPFINQELNLAPQLAALVIIILIIEFIFLSLYASGGKVLRTFLKQSHHIRWLNRISGSVMIALGIWLALGS